MSTIQNISNHCFLSSVVQMLTTSFEIEASFMKPIYRSLFDLYKQRKCIKINELMFYYMNNLHKDIVWGMHQDAHESLGYILDDADDKLSFEIQIKQKSTYKDNSSEVNQKENILLVPLRNSIQESINAYFETEEGIEYIENDKTIITPKIEKWPVNTPDYLFITLIRMKYEMVNGVLQQNKIQDEIEVTSYIEYGGKKYKPIAYIIHQGNTQNGHYGTIKILDDKWTLFNDDRFNILTDQSYALNIQSVAYIFLYQKDDSLQEPPIKYTPNKVEISMLNETRNNHENDIMDIDSSLIGDMNNTNVFFKLYNMDKSERLELKTSFEKLSNDDRDKFITSLREKLGRNLSIGDIYDYFDNKESYDYFNPLNFNSFRTTNRFIIGIKRFVDPKFKISTWFEYTIERRIEITKILCDEDFNRKKLIEEIEEIEEISDDDDVKFDQLLYEDKNELLIDMQKFYGSCTLEDVKRKYDNTPSTEWVDPICFNDDSLDEKFTKDMRKIIDPNFKITDWYGIPIDKRKEYSYKLKEYGISYKNT